MLIESGLLVTFLNNHVVFLDPESPPFLPSSFDRILLDGPCSALGQRPQHMFQKSKKELESFPAYQRKLLTVVLIYTHNQLLYFKIFQEFLKS